MSPPNATVDTVEFLVLGPVEVRVGGVEVEIGGRARTVLALLLAEAGRTVRSDRLIDELWGDSAPESALNMVQGYVSRLRKTIGPAGDGDRLLATRAPGYVLRVAAGQLDCRRFEELVRQGEEQLGRGEVEQAGATFTAALALWRGPPFGDVAPTPMLEAEIARLDELRLIATERRVEAELALGRADTSIAELEGLVKDHPHRERLRQQLMLALYRAGRQLEALEVYQEGRRRLIEDLGLEPGPGLQTLQRAILQHDSALEASTSNGSSSRSLAPAVAPTSPRRSRRFLRLGVAALGAAVAIAAGTAVALDRGSDEPGITAAHLKAHTVAVIDPETNSAVTSVPVGQWPGAMVAAGGYIWVANAGDDTVSQVDPASRTVLGAFEATTPIDLAARDGIVWIANGNSLDGPNAPGGGTVQRYDTTQSLLKTTRVGPSVLGSAEQTVVAAGAEGVWAANGDAARAYRLDMRTGRIAVTASAIIQAGGVAVGEGGVWVTDSVNDLVFRIDAAAGRVRARIPVDDGPTRVAVGEGAVWVIGRFPTSGVWRIDPETNRVVAHVEVPRRAARIAAGAGSIWVTSGTPGEPGPGTVSRIDPQTNRVIAQFDLGPGLRADGVAVANGLVWVAVAPT
mgnify:CR=1 FL=1